MRLYCAYKCASWLSRILPSALAYRLGMRVADCFYRHDDAGRRAVLQNLRHIHEATETPFTDSTLEAMARRTYHHFAKYLVDFFKLGHVSDAWLARRVRLVDEEHFTRCIARGRGVIMVTAHLGNWELGGAVLAARGHHVHAVVLPYRSEKLERLFNACRERRGIRTIPFGRAARDLIRVLRDGKVVALLADRDFSARQHEAKLFNRTVSMPHGPARLAMKTGAAILPCFMTRQEDDSFLLRFHPPLLPEEMETDETVRDRICRVLEKEIAEHPCQWFVFEDFWASYNRHRGQRYG